MVASMNYGTFIFFGIICFLAAGFIFFMVPETKGLTLEEMDEVFGDEAGNAADDRARLDRIYTELGLMDGGDERREDCRYRHHERWNLQARQPLSIALFARRQIGLLLDRSAFVVCSHCFPSSGYTLYTGSAKNAMCTYGCNDTYTLLAILLINLYAKSPGMLFPPHKEILNQTGRASERLFYTNTKHDQDSIKLSATAPPIFI
jgi:hypothetical protein